jgi:hypothetical protein
MGTIIRISVVLRALWGDQGLVNPAVSVYPNFDTVGSSVGVLVADYHVNECIGDNALI